MTEEEGAVQSVTDLDAIKYNTTAAVDSFNERWIPLPRYAPPCDIFTLWELRDMMGLRATADGDPWPAAEKMLRERGFIWNQLGGDRVMFLRERTNLIYTPDGWQEAEVYG